MRISKLILLSGAFLFPFSISGCAFSPQPNASQSKATSNRGKTSASDNELRGPSSVSIVKNGERFVDAQGCWQASQINTEGLLLNPAQMANACRLFVDVPNVHLSCPNKNRPQLSQTRMLILEPGSNPSKVQIFNKKLPDDSTYEFLLSFRRMNNTDAEFTLYLNPNKNTALQQFRLLARPTVGNELDACLSSAANP